ncbi:MAG: PhnA-like protein [Gemmatimonas sp.]
MAEYSRPEGAPHMSPVTPAEDMRTVLINNVSWGAVLAGVVFSLVVQLLLNMLGIGIGAATIHPMEGNSPDASSFSMGAGIWWVVSGIIAAFAGGIVAGRLSGRPKESTTGWHGVTAWALTTLVVFWLLTTAVGSIVGGGLNVLGSITGGIGKTVGQAAQTAAPMVAQNPDPFSGIANQIQAQTGGSDPQAMRDAATAAVKAAVTGDQQQAQQARERAVPLLAKAQNISEDDARQQIDQYQQQYQQAMDQAKQQAIQAADTTTKVVSRAALFSFVSLVLGGIAAWFGGRMGAVDPTIRGYLEERAGARVRSRT